LFFLSSSSSSSSFVVVVHAVRACVPYDFGYDVPEM
jgi:hypothetical protein